MRAVLAAVFILFYASAAASPAAVPDPEPFPDPAPDAPDAADAADNLPLAILDTIDDSFPALRAYPPSTVSLIPIGALDILKRDPEPAPAPAVISTSPRPFGIPCIGGNVTCNRGCMPAGAVCCDKTGGLLSRYCPKGARCVKFRCKGVVSETASPASASASASGNPNGNGNGNGNANANANANANGNANGNGNAARAVAVNVGLLGMVLFGALAIL